MPRTILLVDDCDTTRRLVGYYLKSLGYTIRQAVNGLQAMEQLARGVVDLIITDINMPGMDGITLIKTLRNDRTLASIPIMVLTTEDAPQERNMGLAAGADAYLTKPVSQERLIGEIQRLLPDRPA